MMLRRVAVIGTPGQLASPLVEALAERPHWRVQPLSHRDVEIADAASIAAALDPTPDVVVNTALWASENPEPALRTNALGPRLLADFCAAHGALLAHISTDYVFDGESRRPYTETDRTEARSVYGISKAAGEQLVRARSPRHLIVRVSGLYGAGGSRAKGGTSFPSVMLAKARAGESIEVVTDQVFSPTYARDAARTVVALLEAGVTGTVHVSNSGSCSRYEFAARIFALAGLQPNLRPISLRDLPDGGALQPRYTVLAHDALRAAGMEPPRHWEEGLRDYLAEIGALAAAPAAAASAG